MLRVRYRIALIAVIACWLGHIDSFGQQTFQSNQYMFNPLLYNPAYAGSKDKFNAFFTHRNQWTGFKGSPSTNVLGVHGAMRKQKVALGLQIIGDQLGPSKNTGLQATYAYRIPFESGKLSFGLSGGLHNYRYDLQSVDLPDPTELLTFNSQKLVPTANMGLFYYTKNSFFGYSAINLFKGKTLERSFTGNTVGELYSHHNLMVGRAFEVNEDVVINPSFLLKYVRNAPLDLDLTFNAIIKGKLWTGLSFRTGYGLIVITQYDVGDGLKIGYSFDIVLNSFGSHGGYSHELMLSKDFNLFKTKVVSPRHLF